MVQWVKALTKGFGQMVPMRRGWLLSAIFAVILSPQPGTAQEDVKGTYPAGLHSRRDPRVPVQGFYPDFREPSQQGALLYRFRLAEKHHLIPEFSVNYDRAEMEAPHGTADVQLTYSYLGSPIVLMVNALIDHPSSERKHQAPAKGRSDDRYSLAASIYYTVPWDWPLFQGDAFRLFATGALHSADLHLYKRESASGFAGLQLEW